MRVSARRCRRRCTGSGRPADAGALLLVATLASSGPLGAQETKPAHPRADGTSADAPGNEAGGAAAPNAHDVDVERAAAEPADDGERAAAEGADDDVEELEGDEIVAEEEYVSTIAGAAQRVDEEELKKFSHDDVHRVLRNVPGVYVRGEDGFGLRPNIGIRGASSDRSKKVALMEDGVLFGPAPYSAPAAYYFPMVSRMTSISLLKGPSAIRFGPNTVGGALDYGTRPVPTGLAGGVDAAIGQNAYGKLHAHVGQGWEHFGVLAEGIHLTNHGFKQLDGGGDTGFRKSEFMLKARANTDLSRRVVHELELKVGYSTEKSHETYLGLSDEDFRETPYRRYRASYLDVMDWDRTQAELKYEVDLGKNVRMVTTAYRHDFSRLWNKLDGLVGADIRSVLQNPNAQGNRLYYELLTGEASSVEETLLVRANKRAFISQGVQTRAEMDLAFGPVQQHVEMGVRFHYDEIERDHTEKGYHMVDFNLVPSADPRYTVTKNRAWTHAVALHAIDEIRYADLRLSPGVRVELIQSNFQCSDEGECGTSEDGFPVQESSALSRVVLPGIGAFYSITDELGVLAGVHEGFSPAPPEQAGTAEPEKSLNYELGARYGTRATAAEATGFFNDYQNLTEVCGTSNCGSANQDQQFSGGAVKVWGLEAMASHRFGLFADVELPVRGTYTFTQSRFETSFQGHPVYGDVEVGDSLPYIPEHQGSADVGVEGERWGAHVAATFATAMREQAGQGDVPDRQRTDDFVVFDVSGSYQVVRGLEVYAKLTNVFATAYLAARRPFGARPGQDRWLQAGARYSF